MTYLKNASFTKKKILNLFSHEIKQKQITSIQVRMDKINKANENEENFKVRI